MWGEFMRYVRYVLTLVYLVRESLGRRDGPFVHNAGGGRLVVTDSAARRTVEKNWIFR